LRVQTQISHPWNCRHATPNTAHLLFLPLFLPSFDPFFFLPSLFITFFLHPTLLEWFSTTVYRYFWLTYPRTQISPLGHGGRRAWKSKLRVCIVHAVIGPPTAEYSCHHSVNCMRSISEQKSNYLSSGWLTLLALLSPDIVKGGGPLDDENDISLLKINTNLISYWPTFSAFLCSSCFLRSSSRWRRTTSMFTKGCVWKGVCERVCVCGGGGGLDIISSGKLKKDKQHTRLRFDQSKDHIWNADRK